jgi:DNA invertase Pin-like site-specific DNA recombinase
MTRNYTVNGSGLLEMMLSYTVGRGPGGACAQFKNREHLASPRRATPPMLLYGYARVSTHGQTLEARIEQLNAAGCRKVFRKKISGARADRRQLKRLLKSISQADTVVVTRIDRLARSTFDLFAIIQRIVDAGAHFRSLAEPWADTSTSAGLLMIAVLGGLADVERDLIRTRTSEGRERAKARGVKLGPKFKLTPAERAEALARRAAGETTIALGRSYNVSHTTISRLRP